MSVLTIEARVPISDSDGEKPSSGIAFTHFFPFGIDDGVSVSAEGMKVVLWFDEQCTYHQRSAEELNRYSRIDATFVNVKVEVLGISEELLNHMQKPAHIDESPPRGWTVASEYIQLAEKVSNAVMKRVNRLISAARNIRGQYWLVPYSLNGKEFTTRFDCSASVNGGPSFRFCPRYDNGVFVRVGGAERYIRDVDWGEIVSFVEGEGKPDLVRELLAGAERLAEQEHYRAALTEAVTALEVAISSFASAPLSTEAFGSILAERLGVASLKNQVSHLGLSGTVNFLLPIIFSEEILPASVLIACQSAVRQRQTVVHQGQRDVNSSFANASVSAIRTLCEILRSLSLDETEV